MKTKLLNLWRRSVHGLPEVMLVLFLLALVPMAVMVVRELARQFAMILANVRQFRDTTLANPWTPVAVLVCLSGAALLAYVIVSRWKVVWAVARKMIIEAMHRKVILILLIFFVVMMPTLPFMLGAEGSLKNHVQLVLLYSLALALVLMSLVAICVATASICTEVEQRYVHITDTKPALRWEFLLGKWFGIMVMCTVVLLCMAGTGYALIRYMASRAVYGIRTGSGDPLDKERPSIDVGEVDPSTVPRHKADYNPVEEEVFVARRTIPAKLDESKIEAYIQEGIKAYWRSSRRKKAAIHSHRESLRKEFLTVMQAVGPSATHTWEFGGLDKDKPVTVRFRAVAMGERVIWGRWYTCDKVPVTEPTKDREARYEYRPRRATDGELLMVPAPRNGWTMETLQEVPMPLGSVGKDGFLYLQYKNSWDPRSGNKSFVQFSVTDMIEVMQREEGFLPNYYRTLVILLFHIGLLAALGLMVGSLFSFPVATMLAVCMFAGGLVAPWFYTQFVLPDPYAMLSETTVVYDAVWRGFAGFIMALLPDFGSFSPLDDLIHGKMVTWGHVAVSGSVLFFLKGGTALLVAFYFYTRRELARVIV